ncbi:hypothetical protein O181_065553 [Austropuccinia psidii MF-1]|uniref:Uncharacterized protein n=1 Tax=Austropuccinia psidii MF-1 TaxID=1389203 RepID=A0A9Q3EVJ9_9BASI|nr:hypothetical protein [Austropuccinia psidii MF-1]
MWDLNQSCINTTNGNCKFNNKQMKNGEIQLYFIKEVIPSSAIQLQYAASSDILADFLTKSVIKENLLRALTNLHILRLAVRGDVEYSDSKHPRIHASTEVTLHGLKTNPQDINHLLK